MSSIERYTGTQESSLAILSILLNRNRLLFADKDAPARSQLPTGGDSPGNSIDSEETP
jgi:hypothetical protein